MLGQVIIGDIAATLVDLSLRGLLSVDEEADDGRADWVLRPLHVAAPRHQQDSLLDYERTLLDAVSGSGPAATLASLAPRIPEGLDRARAAIMHDAIRRGWLHRFRSGQRTDAGDQLATRIRGFHRDLRRLATEHGQGALADRLLPYALHFGMIDRSQVPLGRFAQAWVETFVSLPAWHQQPRGKPDFTEPDATPKPTIDEQLQHLDTYLFLK
jgi:hypothetical protein